MKPHDQKRDEALNAIGRELDDLHLSGRLDFDSFKTLFLRGLQAAGDDRDDLEMFQPVIQDRSWSDWMVQELRKSAPSRRVA